MGVREHALYEHSLSIRHLLIAGKHNQGDLTSRSPLPSAPPSVMGRGVAYGGRSEPPAHYTGTIQAAECGSGAASVGVNLAFTPFEHAPSPCCDCPDSTLRGCQMTASLVTSPATAISGARMTDTTSPTALRIARTKVPTAPGPDGWRKSDHINPHRRRPCAAGGRWACRALTHRAGRN